MSAVFSRVLHAVRSSDKGIWILAAAALALYLPAIWWGLPDGVSADRARPWGTDELGPVGAINEIYSVFLAHHPYFNPQYPLFHYFVQLVFVAPYYAGLWLTGHISSPAPAFPFGLDRPSTELAVLTLFARLPSLLMAIGVVLLAFRTGAILRGRTAGVLFAVLVLVQYPMFYYARTSNVDMAALFWTACALMLCARALVQGATTGLAIGLGVVAALAVAAKDPSYGACLPIGVVFAIDHVRTARGKGAGWIDSCRAPAYALAAAVAVYLVASGLVFRLDRYERHIRYITTHGGRVGDFYYFRYPATVAGYLGLGRELVQNMIDAIGLPMLVAAVAGAAFWAWRARRLLWWLLPAIGVIAAVIVPVRFVLLRFVMIVAYILALPAADWLARGLARPGPMRRLAAVAATVVVVWSGVRGADLTWQMMNDSRYAAADWLRTAVRPGDRVGHFVPAANLPALPEGVTTMSLATGLPEQSSADRPEFIVSMPLRDGETLHEGALPDALFEQLTSGLAGYRQAALVETPTLFSRRPASYVSPPVRIFVRDDVWFSRRFER